MNFPNIPNPAINHPSSPRNFISTDHFSTISSNKHSAPKRAWDASHRSIHPRNPRPYPRNYSVPPLENIQRKIQKKATKEKRKADSSRKFCLFPKLRSDRTKGKRKKGGKNRKEKEWLKKRATTVSRSPEVGACTGWDTFHDSSRDVRPRFNEGCCVQEPIRRPGWQDLKTVTAVAERACKLSLHRLKMAWKKEQKGENPWTDGKEERC